MKIKTLIIPILLGLLFLPLFSPSVLGNYPEKQTEFMILYAGTPDGYGNQITEIDLLQDPGTGNYVSRGTVNYSVYTGSDTITGIQNQSTRFVVSTWLNYTFADSPTQAKAFAKVFLTVSGQFTDQAMTAGAVTYYATGTGENEAADDFWVIEHTYTWDYPLIATYTVSLEYYSLGQNIVSSPQDLTGYGVGETFQFHPDGYVITHDGNDYGKAAGFQPLDNLGAFSIEIWFMPGSTSGTQFIVNQYNADGQHSVAVFQSGTSIRGRVGDGASYADVTVWGFDNTSHVYHIIYTWDKTNNSGYANLWLDGALTTAATGITSDTDCAADMNIGRRETGNTNYLVTGSRIYQIALYDTQLNRTDVESLYASGEGYALSGVDHIYTFEEYALGIYEWSPWSGSSVALDGYYLWVNSENWDFSFNSLSISAALFPFPIDYPGLYIWLIFGVGIVIFGPIYAIGRIRSASGVKKADVIILMLVLLIIGWGIFVTGAT